VRVLIVEDETKMAGLLRRALAEESHLADIVGDGETAVAMARASDYDAIVMDVMLPRMDGFTACRLLRDASVWTPLLLLTARDAVADRVAGLDSGADDYLTKPFSFDELLARLRALVRRGETPRPATIVVGTLRLDPATRRVWRGEDEIELTTKEFTLLETFMRRPGMVLSRSRLLEYAWDYGLDHRSNLIDVYVRHLREKIDRPFGSNSLRTVRGAGYRLDAARQ
jgi:two-component system, OmpR family, response regulator